MHLLDGINDTEDELYTFDSIMETEDEDAALEALEDIKQLISTIEIAGRKDRAVVRDELNIIEKELKDYKRLIEILSKYIKLDDNYDEMNSGSTKAFKVCIPNCISIEEDDDYTDDCYPNSDYDFINDLLKEVLSND